MILPKDTFGRTIQIGDYLIRPVRIGNLAELTACRVLQIFEMDRIQVQSKDTSRPSIVTHPERCLVVKRHDIPDDWLSSIDRPRNTSDTAR